MSTPFEEALILGQAPARVDQARYKVDSTQETDDSARQPTLWQVGGDDIALRIPLLLEMRRRGYRVSAVGSQDPTSFVEHNIPYWRYPLARGVNPLADRRTKKYLGDLFARHQPDIVHAFSTKPAILAALAAKRAMVPACIRTVTGMGYVFSSSSATALGMRPVLRHLHRRASRAASVTVFQNRDDLSYFVENRMVPLGRHKLIPGSGVVVDDFARLRVNSDEAGRRRAALGLPNRPVVTMISRMVRHKGVVKYLEAARAVRNNGGDATFLLVGPLESEGGQGVPRERIERDGDVVKYLGQRDDVPFLLSLSDVFVLPTCYREGVPRVLLEAGAMGLPLVTTDMPGCRDVVQNNATGIVVPPGDSVALADALMRLLASPDRWAPLGRAAQRHIRATFDLRIIADAYDGVYQGALRAAALLGERNDNC